MKSDRKICVGVIAASHGVRGFVRLHSFTEDPDALFDYTPITDETGERVFTLTPQSIAKDHYVVAVDGVKDRDAADELKGTKLYISHLTLPKPGKSEFYIQDLLGLAVVDQDGKDHGVVQGVHDYGAGAFIEIGATKKASFMLPFNNAYVPNIDMKEERITVNIPEGWP